MHIQNETKNQHFVSQVEQKLNASNPSSPKKIYSFKIIDRENYLVQLEGNKAKKIEKTLSSLDLFSFDVESNQFRNNFEAIFGEYEKKIESHTISLLKKLEENNYDIKEELLNLFVLKLLNTFRNPYCIKKTLNTIGNAGLHTPLDKELAKDFEKVENGKKPQKKWLSKQLGVTEKEYVHWLKTLFIMLMRPSENEPNLLEDIIRSLYEKDSHKINVVVFSYDVQLNAKSVLLSDRGFSLAVPEEQFLAYEFNLCSKAFITYAFTDIDTSAPDGTHQNVIDFYKQSEHSVSVQHIKNNLDALTRYNKNVVYQSFERVYCSCSHVYGL